MECPCGEKDTLIATETITLQKPPKLQVQQSHQLLCLLRSSSRALAIVFAGHRLHCYF